MNEVIEFPAADIRRQLRRPPLGALAWAVCKVEGRDKSLLTGRNRISLTRIRLAENSIPPALATAWTRLAEFGSAEGLGRDVRRFGLLPGAQGERFLTQFAENPPKTSVQDAWERWAAGLLGLRGFTIDDAAKASELLLPITVGCRPSWLRGKQAELWKQCWAQAQVSPPPYWSHA